MADDNTRRIFFARYSFGKCNEEVVLTKIGEAFGAAAAKDQCVVAIVFHPADLYPLVAGTKFSYHFDRETMRRNIQRGIAGYFWAATVHHTAKVNPGEFVVLTEEGGIASRSIEEIAKQYGTATDNED